MKLAFALRRVLAAGLLATGEMSVAGPLPPIAFLSIGFREARVSDFSPGTDLALRRHDAKGFLSVTADFNGDGHPDEARVLINQSRRVVYVVAVIQTKQVDTYVLSSYDLASAEKLGIRAAQPKVGSGLIGLTVFDIQSGVGSTSYFDGSEFNSTAPASSQSL